MLEKHLMLVGLNSYFNCVSIRVQSFSAEVAKIEIGLFGTTNMFFVLF